MTHSSLEWANQPHLWAYSQMSSRNPKPCHLLYSNLFQLAHFVVMFPVSSMDEPPRTSFLTTSLCSVLFIGIWKSFFESPKLATTAKDFGTALVGSAIVHSVFSLFRICCVYRTMSARSLQGDRSHGQMSINNHFIYLSIVSNITYQHENPKFFCILSKFGVFL